MPTTVSLVFACAMRQHILLNGRVFAYLDSHPPDVAARSRPPSDVLLLLHAFPLNAGMWQPQFAAAPAGWRLVAPDLQGLGQSAIDESTAAVPTLESDAGDLVALLDHLGAAAVVVAGLSMGGYLAMALCRLAPTRVRAVVLANTRADADSAEERGGRGRMMAQAAQAGVAAVVEQLLPRLLGETSRRGRPAVVARVRELAAQNGVDGVVRAIGAMMRRPDSTALLATLVHPALVVASDEDSITPVDRVRAMHRTLRESTFALVPAAGHLSSLEHPDAFNDALHRFLAVVRSRS